MKAHIITYDKAIIMNQVNIIPFPILNTKTVWTEKSLNYIEYFQRIHRIQSTSKAQQLGYRIMNVTHDKAR